MGKILNRWSFFLSFVCAALVIILSTNYFKQRILHWTGVHPLEIVFYLSLTVLLFGVAGFSGVYNWKAAVRSIFTVGFSLLLSIFLAYILFVGNLMD
ncbi:hypothetical protein ACFYKX_02910 [Cytobacillus sp. FJAT-54145]|uniref:DUF340 domain-containing protein n=1 Tax=Cytobacillus spartinae TaxID=3299023 RepID=A0ABW6K5V1_9BACI